MVAVNIQAHERSLDLHTAASVMQGVLVGINLPFVSVEIDSRRVTAEGLFFAIRGDAQDGHAFIASAVENGAVAAVVDHAPEEAICPVIVVDDTTSALGSLAQFWRTQFAIPVVGVTGSNGKTTVSAMLREIFAVSMPGVAPMGSFNNHWGVPLTLLTLNEASQSAVIEMGMNHPGELSYLTDIVHPDVALITNAATAHLEGLVSVAGVAKAKAEIIDGVPDGGVVVLNAEDAFLPLWQARAHGRKVVRFGRSDDAEVWADDIRVGHGTQFVLHANDEQVSIRLALLGAHNVMNALAAAAVALAAGACMSDIQTGLAAVQASSGRLQSKAGQNGAQLIDDSYNANPASIRAGLHVLAAYPGKRIAALGAMAELGDQSEFFHRELGQLAAELGIDVLVAVGEGARAYAAGFGDGVQTVNTIDEAAAWLLPQLEANTHVLIKGSRSAGMERLVAALQKPSREKNINEADVC